MRTCVILFSGAILASSTWAREPDRPSAAGSSRAEALTAKLDLGIERLTRDLTSKDAHERLQAAVSLGKLRGKIGDSVWQVSQLLSDPDPAVRMAAADVLMDIDDVSLIHPLLDAASDRDPRVQVRAAIGINHLASLYWAGTQSDELSRKITTPKWYPMELQRAERRSVRSLLELACEQPVSDVAAALPVLMKCIGGGDHHLCKDVWAMLPKSSIANDLGRLLADDDPRIRRGAARMLFCLETGMPTAQETRAAFEPLVAALDDRDPVVRRYCLFTLAKHKKAAGSLFVKMAGDPDTAVRCVCVETLLCRRPKQTVEVLCRLLENDSSSRVRVRAAFALAELAQSSSAMAKAVADEIGAKPKPRTRVLLEIAALYDWDEEEDGAKPRIEEMGAALPSLLKAIRAERARPLPELDNIRDTDEFDLRIMSVLGAVGPAARPAVPWLLRDLENLDSLGDNDYRSGGVNSRLQSCLYMLASIGATDELVEALDHPHRVVRTVAAMALSEHPIYARRVVPILIDSLDEPCWGQCVMSHVRGANVSCLAILGHEAVPALLDLLRHDKNVFSATDALCSMEADARRVVPLLVPVLNDRSEPLAVRVAIAKALSIAGAKHPKALKGLCAILLDSGQSESLRVAVAEHLGNMGSREARAALNACVGDNSKTVRAAVQKAIRQFDMYHADQRP
jgi:HEAT repeat protein